MLNYICECKNGFYGFLCENVDYCYNIFCFNNGLC